MAQATRKCCDSPSPGRLKRGMCSRCYQRAARRGELRPQPLLSLEERFWAKVSAPRLPGACWEWEAASVDGYGVIRNNGALLHATHVSLSLAGTEVPVGGMVRHSCDNPPCVNPEHLTPGTHPQNMADMVQRGRSNRGERHPNSKLTEAQVQKILTYLATSRTAAELGRQYGVSEATIRAIRSGRSWTYLRGVA